MMDGADISGFGTPNADVPIQSSPITGTSKDSGAVNASTSTIQTSSIEAAEMMFAAQFPSLIPPSQSIVTDPATAILQISMMVDQKKNDIISSMWDSFDKNTRELAERAKKEDIKKWTENVGQNGPKSATEYYAYILAVSAAALADETTGTSAAGQNALSAQFGTAFNQWISIPSDASTAVEASSKGNYPNPAFIVGCLACGSDVVREAIGAVSQTTGSQLSVSPIADALAAVGPTSGLPVDSQSAAALVAALLNGGAVYKATIDSVEESSRSGQPPQDLGFALNYAKNILAIVSHNVEGDAAANIGQGQNQMIRLMLSVMALNLVYRASYGGMEGGKEFTALLEPGGTADLDPAIKPVIDNLMTQVNKFLPSEASLRAQTIASLSEYIDSKDSVDSMLSTTRLFAASLGVKTDVFQA